MPAIPLIGLGISGYSAYKQAKSAQNAAKMQQGIADKQSALAQQLQLMGKGQMNAGQPALNKAMEYYMRLAGGNRGALNAAIAPEKNQMLEGYRGAEQGLNARLAPGPDRDRAIAELYRQRAGQAGMLPFQAKAGAVDKLGTLGGNQLKLGADLASSAANVYGGASRSTEAAAGNNADAWEGYGSLGANATKAAQGVWDWYKNRHKPTGPGPWAGGYQFPGSM